MLRPSLKTAIEWIALNDSPADEPSENELIGFISVALVSDLFGVPQEKTAAAVFQYRENLKRKTAAACKKIEKQRADLRLAAAAGRFGRVMRENMPEPVASEPAAAFIPAANVSADDLRPASALAAAGETSAALVPPAADTNPPAKIPTMRQIARLTIGDVLKHKMKTGRHPLQ